MGSEGQAENTDALAERIAALGLTRHGFAVRAGISHHTLQGVLTGRRAHGVYVRGPHQSSIAKVVAALEELEKCDGA